ncbi:hypothetical protein HPT27_00985 [Permianibacter sp. IMCC34836]|uniref:hypothetical protein n=1 Tax=Permianibacter fluminis TaxID=2738515 RepID=UPI001551DF79|nr:hypothetical protein [Permianibacter fluminis]NQD35575.1 hypothetical protein [Permianibacter fluminis]
MGESADYCQALCRGKTQFGSQSTGKALRQRQGDTKGYDSIPKLAVYTAIRIVAGGIEKMREWLVRCL